MPRNDGAVNTHEAAAMYGCSSNHLIRMMERHGVTPVEAGRRSRGAIGWWRPEDVLRVRSLRKNPADNINHAHTTGARALARARQTEAYRQRVLARIAARQQEAA